MDLKGMVTFLLVIVVSLCVAEGLRLLTKEEDLELERQLKILNKPSVKTIQTNVGDVYDCVDIYKQPAFDNPLLKNHKIQLKPEFTQEETVHHEASSSTKITNLVFELQSERCPSGTVPIRRTTKEDLINAKSFSKSYHANVYPISPMTHHHVSLEVLDNKLHYGGQAHISVHNPVVEKDQFSTAQIWIMNGPETEVNSIEFGWAVYPELSGDNRTRLFAYWTADGYNQKGCFNTLCPGFVQVHPSVILGDVFTKISTIGGQQYAMLPTVYRDQGTGNWWLTCCNDNQKVGYWPKELFTHLAISASVIKYGGVAGAKPNRPTPPMGSGLFNKHYRYCCYMSNMKVVEDNGEAVDFVENKIRKTKDVSDCYDLRYYGHDGKMELTMIFGGQGGMCSQ